MTWYCDECKWFATHFLSDAQGNVYEHQVCLDGYDVEDCSCHCRGFVEASEDDGEF